MTTTTTTTGAPESWAWIVTLDTGNAALVAAAYFKAEDGLTVFKDHRGKAVHAVNTSRIVSIDREDHAATGTTITVGGITLDQQDLNEVLAWSMEKAAQRGGRR